MPKGKKGFSIGAEHHRYRSTDAGAESAAFDEGAPAKRPRDGDSAAAGNAGKRCALPSCDVLRYNEQAVAGAGGAEEVLGEDVANTWEGSCILFKIEATVATATREMALQQLETAIELARRSGFEADEVQKALDASFPNGSILRWLKLAAKGTDEKLSMSDSAKLTVRERAALKKLVREALDDDGARADMVHVMAADDLWMVEVLQEQGGDGMVKALASNLVHEARGVLDLLSGIIAIRAGETPYEDEILSVVKCVREMFGNVMLLAPRARGLQALRENCPAAPQYKVTRGLALISGHEAAGAVEVARAPGVEVGCRQYAPYWRYECGGLLEDSGGDSRAATQAASVAEPITRAPLRFHQVACGVRGSGKMETKKRGGG